ncbi:GPW/gp25 family protein [Pararobbsia silviterrae]|uniref:Phage baseplate protein n=1 Tax=Pararobbsia silviterrae TaxID=1792498 RepID=A0A494Y7S4_9BURK|nr:GPW/gp25 family protein [Pararobbsia silviterrae]RKP55970.1 phage baseplate protein [Pararobbsia silviterrae]
MNDDLLTRVFGRGWAFPPAFSLDVGVDMAEGAEDVRESLRILFSTEPGERIMREDYGCALYDVMFASINSELMSDIETRIVDAVLLYEPRASLRAIRVEQIGSTSRVAVEVLYCLRGHAIERRVAGVVDVHTADRGRIV